MASADHRASRRWLVATSIRRMQAVGPCRRMPRGSGVTAETRKTVCAYYHIVLHVVLAVVAFCALHAREQTVDPTPCHRQRTRLDVSFSHRTVAVINTTCRSLARSL